MSSDENIETTVGQKIRADREAAGMTVEQLAQATRIMVTFVEALERDDISALPGKVFGKGFIKSIYKVLGKDSAEVIRQYDAENGVEQTRVVPVTQVEPVRTDIVRRESGARHLPLKFILGATLIGALLVGVIWLLSSQGGQQEIASVEKPAAPAVEQFGEETANLDGEAAAFDEDVAEEPSEENAAAEDVMANMEAEEPETTKEEAPAPADQIQPQPDVAAMQADATTNQAQLLEITVRKKVKIRMNIDQKGWETNELTPDTYQFRFEDAASLLLFDAGAVEMSFNGKNLGSLGAEGRVRRLSFVAGSPDNKTRM